MTENKLGTLERTPSHTVEYSFDLWGLWTKFPEDGELPDNDDEVTFYLSDHLDAVAERVSQSPGVVTSGVLVVAYFLWFVVDNTDGKADETAAPIIEYIRKELRIPEEKQ